MLDNEPFTVVKEEPAHLEPVDQPLTAGRQK
jgi:hypothetical protein